jgi:hypothetical protein
MLQTYSSDQDEMGQSISRHHLHGGTAMILVDLLLVVIALSLDLVSEETA